MCFSVQADLIAGSALIPLAAYSLREVRTWRELPFAALPALFSIHQLIESVVWMGLDGDVSAHVQKVAALVYILIAFPLLPILLPVSVILIEPRGFRRPVLPFVVLGSIVSVYLLYGVLSQPIDVVRRPHAIDYSTGVAHADWWAVLYVIAVVGPPLLSGYRSIVSFGVLNLIGLSLVGILYVEAFASVWCVIAAMLSVLVVVHMHRRRTLRDPHLNRKPRLKPSTP